MTYPAARSGEEPSSTNPFDAEPVKGRVFTPEEVERRKEAIADSGLCALVFSAL